MEELCRTHARTIVKNSLQLVEEVMEARGLYRETVKCRVVIDGGQGLLKIVASIFDSSVAPKSQDPSEKMTGVNRLLLLAGSGLPNPWFPAAVMYNQ